MTSAWYFKEPLRNETKSFIIISKFCSLWLVYTVTPSNSTHYYLTSSISPFNTETTKNFPAEEKTTENLRMYSVTWQSTLGEFVTSHRREYFFIYDSNWYRRLLILWTLDNCDFYLEQSSMSRGHRKQKRRSTMGMSFHKEGECRSISAKPTCINKGKDIPKLPENYKQLYQFFRLFHCHSYNNIAVIFHCFYM